MRSGRIQTGILALVGVLLVANTVWLFPHAGDLRYTYERKQIGVENGTLTYHGRSGTEFGGEYSDFPALGCQYLDTDGRACAFDRYLVTHGPVTTARQRAKAAIPEFVHLDGGYYRRMHRHNGSASTYDIERITGRDFLRTVAVNLTGTRPADLSESQPLDVRLAVKGGTMTSVEDPEDDELGRIYRRNGRYYTVVLTDQEAVDPLLPVSPGLRRLLEMAGGLALLIAVVDASHHMWTSE